MRRRSNFFYEAPRRERRGSQRASAAGVAPVQHADDHRAVVFESGAPLRLAALQDLIGGMGGSTAAHRSVFGAVRRDHGNL